MGVTRVSACVLVLAALTVGVFAYYVYWTDQNWDETFHVKGALVSPSDYTSPEGYRYAIDHPALGRYIYRWALAARDIHTLNVPDVDYPKGEEWNRDNGRFVPFGMVVYLRFVNAAFMAAAVALFFATALLVLKNAWLALLTALPLVLSERVATGVVAYLGTDAILAFFIALSLFLWVFFAMKGRGAGLAAIILTGIATGLAASTKANGALLVIAYCIYLAVATKGVDRFAKPFFALVVAGLAFVLTNPIMRGGGIDWAVAVVSDMLARRERIWVSQFDEMPLSRADIIRRFFPWTVFILPMAAALVSLRKEKWVLPTVIWGAVLVLGTVVSVNRTYKRYFLPVEMAVYFTAGVAAWRLVQASLFGSAASRWSLRRLAMPVLAVLAAVAVMATVAAAYAPWGPSRVRRGVPAVTKARIFFRQAAAYSGAAERLSEGEVRRRIIEAKRRPPSVSAASLRMPRPLFEPATRQKMSMLLFLVACGVSVAVGKKAIGDARLGVLIVLPLLWEGATEGRLLAVSMSQSLLLLSSAVGVYLLCRMFAAGNGAKWRWVTALAAAGAAATAASPSGALFVAVAAALVMTDKRENRPLAKAAAVVALSSVFYMLIEPALWYLGARASLDAVQALRWGALLHWTARFSETTDFLMPLGECFVYWPLLPVAAAALYAVRNEAWVRPVSLWAGVVVLGVIVAQSRDTVGMSTGVLLSLSMAAGLAGIALLKRHVSVTISLKDAGVHDEEAASGR